MQKPPQKWCLNAQSCGRRRSLTALPGRAHLNGLSKRGHPASPLNTALAEEASQFGTTRC